MVIVDVRLRDSTLFGAISESECCTAFAQKLFESISVTLSPSLSNVNPQLGNESIEPYLVDIIQMFYSLNENFWRRYSYEVCRQVAEPVQSNYL